jgi:hypothetical protein
MRGKAECEKKRACAGLLLPCELHVSSDASRHCYSSTAAHTTHPNGASICGCCCCPAAVLCHAVAALRWHSSNCCCCWVPVPRPADQSCLTKAAHHPANVRRAALLLLLLPLLTRRQPWAWPPHLQAAIAATDTRVNTSASVKVSENQGHWQWVCMRVMSSTAASTKIHCSTIPGYNAVYAPTNTTTSLTPLTEQQQADTPTHTL